MQFNLHINWDSSYAGMPDSMNIIMLSSFNNAQKNTIAGFDDLSFYYGSSGIETRLEDILTDIYPNPAKDVLSIPNEGMSKVDIYGVRGEFLLHVSSGDPIIQIGLSSFTSGIYFIRIKNRKGVRTFKLVVD